MTDGYMRPDGSVLCRNPKFGEGPSVQFLLDLRECGFKLGRRPVLSALGRPAFEQFLVLGCLGQRSDDGTDILRRQNLNLALAGSHFLKKANT